VIEREKKRSGEDKREKGEVDEEMEGWERVLREWIDGADGGEVDETEDVEGEEGTTTGGGGGGGALVNVEESLANPFASASSSSTNPTTTPKSSFHLPPSSSSGPSPSSSHLPKSQHEIDQAQDEAIFLSSYIPRNLSEVYDPERDVELVKRGEGADLIYARSGGVGIVGVDREGGGKKSGKKVGFEGIEEEERSEEEEDGEGSGSGSEDEEGEGEEFEKGAPRGKRHEDRDAKKVSPSLPRSFLLLPTSSPQRVAFLERASFHVGERRNDADGFFWTRVGCGLLVAGEEEGFEGRGSREEEG